MLHVGRQNTHAVLNHCMGFVHLPLQLTTNLFVSYNVQCGDIYM